MNPGLPATLVQDGTGMFGFAAAVGVGAILVQAGVAKLRHRTLVPGVIANYRLLPAALTAPAAAALPFAELAIGLAAVAGSRIAAAAAIALLLVFAAAMGINVARGRTHIDCGCGRPELRQPLNWLLVGRNLVLAAALLPRLVPAPAPSPFELVAAVAGGACLFVLYHLFNAVAALSASPLAAKRR